MVNLVFLLFVGSVVVGKRELNFFSSDITNSDLDFPQSVSNQEAYSAQGSVDTGNKFRVGTIDDRLGTTEDVFGVGIGQYAKSNNATGGKEVNSGNIIDIGDLDEADVKTEGTALNNFAFGGTSDQGMYDANAGNIQSFGNISNSELDINATAKYNYAYSQYGNANAGNEITIGDITDSDFNLYSNAMYNTAYSVEGDANAGNVLNTGQLGTGIFNVDQTILGNKAYSRDGEANIGNQINTSGLRRKLMKAEEY